MDFVLLVLFQFDVKSEWMQRALVLSYDLNGNFIKNLDPGFLMDGSEPYISCSINEQLEIKYTYILNVGNNRSTFFQCKPCEKFYKTDTYQIQNSGHDNLISTVDHGLGTFEYIPQSGRSVPLRPFSGLSLCPLG